MIKIVHLFSDKTIINSKLNTIWNVTLFFLSANGGNRQNNSLFWWEERSLFGIACFAVDTLIDQMKRVT
jgi:hypothetical protein